MSSPAADLSVTPWAAQRVEVYCLWPTHSADPVLVRGPSDAPALPGVVLAHGEHPLDAAERALDGVPGAVGARFRARAVYSEVDLRGGPPGLHVLRIAVEADHAVPLPVDEALLRRPAPAPVSDDVPGAPPRVQRPAAYVVAIRDGAILLCHQVHSRLWSLPGGGIDHGEHPEQALAREMHEETGLAVTDLRLLGLDSRTFTGRSPASVLEHFHGVRILYAGTVADGEPTVQEVDGSTDVAEWVPLERLPDLPLADLVRAGLALVR